MAKVVAFGRQTVKNAIPHIQKFMYYAKVELIPPKPSEIPKMFSEAGALLSAFKSGAWKNVTVKEATVNTLICTEIFCWFFIGECIGKRHVVGYKLN